jgi:ribosome assembly protein YihI (activator of Der GTPase)
MSKEYNNTDEMMKDYAEVVEQDRAKLVERYKDLTLTEFLFLQLVSRLDHLIEILESGDVFNPGSREMRETEVERMTALMEKRPYDISIIQDVGIYRAKKRLGISTNGQ